MSTLINVVLSGSATGKALMDHFVLAYSGKSLFQLCMERNALFADRQLVIGHNDFYTAAKANLKLIGNRTYLSIVEEDHLTDLYSAAFAAFSGNSEEILLITPSHYMIRDTPAYREAVEEAIQLAEHEMIAVLAFRADQAIEHMSFITTEGDRITAIEYAADSKEAKLLSKSKKHLAYSGILCCKAGVYLKELKALQPDVFKAAQNTWKTRVGQYVAAEARTKIPNVQLEEVLLPASDKVKVVVMTSSRLLTPSKNNNNKAAHNEESSNGSSTQNKDLHLVGVA